MIDLVGPAIEAGVFVVGGVIAWTVNATKTSKDAEAVKAKLDDVTATQTKRLDDHAVSIDNLQRNYVSRRELDDKVASSMAAINANYANIKEQLTTHGRWLEYAVFNKKPNQPTLSGGEK